MPKSKKQSRSLLSIIRNLSKKQWLFIGIFTIVATVIVSRTYAATRKPDLTLKLPTEQIAISLSNEKPTVISKDARGNITHESRGKSIDVTASGTVYCTPENQGDVKVVQITPEEVTSILNKVDQVNPEQNAKNANNNQVSVGNSKQLQIVNNGEAQTLQSELSQSSLGIQNAEKILEEVCGKAQTSVPEKSLPVLSPPRNAVQTKSSQFNLRALIPKAYAGGTPVASIPTAPPAHEEWTERHHIARINNDRAVRGIAGLGRSECLTIAARKWAHHMALVNTLYHSPLQNTVEAECGPNWWRKIGENVGKGGSPDSQYDAYMASPGHRANILDPAFQRVGVGAYSYQHPSNPWRLLWTTQLFAACIGPCAEK